MRDALEPDIQQALNDLIPDGAPVRSPTIIERVVRRIAQRAFAHGQATAWHEARSTEQAAEELGVSVRRVRALARSRGLGTRIGRDLLFTPEDVDAMRERRPGRPVGS